MDKKVIIGVVIAIVAILLVVGFFVLGNSPVTLVADDMQVTLPGNYSASSDFAASAGDINISFMERKGSADKDFHEKFFKSIVANGKGSGYENITNKTLNDTKIYEFAAHPKNLKNVSSEREATSEGEAWTVYSPDFAAPEPNGVDHFRSVFYIKGDKVYCLYITAGNSSTNLYTPEIDGIINSIAPAAKK